mgnify:CR=1 FL=1
MKYSVAFSFLVLASAVSVIWPREVLAFGHTVSNTFHSAYVTHFFDKATFLVNCL